MTRRRIVAGEDATAHERLGLWRARQAADSEDASPAVRVLVDEHRRQQDEFAETELRHLRRENERLRHIMTIKIDERYERAHAALAGLVALVLCILVPAVAVAQVPAGNLLGPNDSLRVTWPTSVPTDADGLDAPTGYRVKAVKPTQTGVIVQSWDVGLVTTLTLTAAMIPSGAFSLSVHPFNVAGEAASSNVVGPFGKAAIPQTVTGVAAVRIAP